MTHEFPPFRHLFSPLFSPVPGFPFPTLYFTPYYGGRNGERPNRHIALTFCTCHDYNFPHSPHRNIPHTNNVFGTEPPPPRSPFPSPPSRPPLPLFIISIIGQLPSNSNWIYTIQEPGQNGPLALTPCSFFFLFFCILPIPYTSLET